MYTYYTKSTLLCQLFYAIFWPQKKCGFYATLANQAIKGGFAVFVLVPVRKIGQQYLGTVRHADPFVF